MIFTANVGNLKQAERGAMTISIVKKAGFLLLGIAFLILTWYTWAKKMPDPISWYLLPRTATDDASIMEKIDEKVLAHNQDPSAHGQSAESLYEHRIAPLIDHINYSVYNLKIAPTTRAFKAFVGPSATGDFESLQEAIDYVNLHGGGRIYVRPGTYQPGTNIVLYSNIELIGEDNDTCIIDFQGGSYTIEAKGTPSVGKRNIHLKNIQVRNSIDTNDGAVCFYYCTDWSVRECKFYNNYNSSDQFGFDIVADYADRGVVENCYSTESDRLVYTAHSANIKVLFNHIADCYTGAIEIGTGGDCLVLGNTIDAVDVNHGDGIVLDGASKTRVIGNYISGCTDDFIKVGSGNSSDNNTIQGNHIVAGLANANGIRVLTDSGHNIITGNFIEISDIGTTGIYLDDGDRNVVVSNNIHTSAVSIVIDATCDRTIVVANLAWAGITNNGVNTELGHNIIV